MMLRRSTRLVRRTFVFRSLSSAKTGDSQLFVTVSSEVAQALRDGRAVVALESTIISHGGLPYPKNLELARQAEDTVRRNGAVPATCAVINGVPKVGLDLNDLEILANSKASGKNSIMKASRRDLPFACANKRNASTTVAGTMVLANLAGVRVFATGGIGGVHRGAEASFDISADLLELGRTPVAVVCAGVKSILDIPKTLEVLETQGVPVVSLGTDSFPAFFTNDSGVKSPLTAQSPRELAGMLAAARGLRLQTGTVVAVPNPEPHADPAELEACIQEALKSAEKEGVTGPAITPYLLARVEVLTGGRSLTANVALLLNNARVAALLAVELAAIINCGDVVSSNDTAHPPAHEFRQQPKQQQQRSRSADGKGRVVVVGAAACDVIASMSQMVALKMGSSNPGQVRNSFGGVARNISERLACLGEGVSLCSTVGDDDSGRSLLAHAELQGVDVSHTRVVEGAHTACYAAVHGPGGDLVVSVADMAILQNLREEDIAILAGSVRQSSLVVSDGNLSPPTFAALGRLCASYSIPLFFEPTSDHKCVLPIRAKCLPLVDVVKPNASELRAMVAALLEEGTVQSRATVQNVLSGKNTGDLVDVRILAQALVQAMRGTSAASKSPHMTAEGVPRAVRHKHVLVSLGADGVLWATEAEAMKKHLRDPRASLSGDGLIATLHIPCASIDDLLPEGVLANTNGCGDAFCAGVIRGMLLEGEGLTVEAIQRGHEAAHDNIIKSLSSSSSSL